MSMTDPISDMLTRIRNASMAGLPVVEIPHSKLKSELARILKREGYIREYTTEGHAGKRSLRLFLKFLADDTPAIRGLKRVSKPGLRLYAGARNVPRVLGGMGVAILSTSVGILTDQEARKRNTGGEILCHVW